MHHGITGQKRGVRRYQLANGTYTEEGNKRYRKKKEKPEKPEKPSAPGKTEETVIVTNSNPKTTEYNEAEEAVNALTDPFKTKYLKRLLSSGNASKYIKKGTEAFANSKFSQGMNKTATEAFSSFKTTTKKTASKIVEAITTNVNGIKKLFNK